MMRPRTTFAITAALGVAVSALSATPSIAQDSGATAPAGPACTVDGAWALCPGVWLGSAGAEIDRLNVTQDGVTLTVSADFLATFDVGVSDTTVEGTWSMDGNWTMDATTQGTTGRANVDSNLEGKITGTSARLQVDGELTNNGTFDVGGIPQIIRNTHPLNGLVIQVEGGTCVEAVGAWELSWAALAADAGWNGTEAIRGDFTAIRQPGFESDIRRELGGRLSEDRTTEAEIQASQLSAPVKEVLSSVLAYNNTVGSVSEPNDASIGRLLTDIDRVEKAINALANEMACEPAIDEERIQKYRKVAATMIEQTIAWASNNTDGLSGTTLRNLTLRATSIGAIGPASTSPNKAETEANLATAIQTTLENRTTATDGDTLQVKPEFTNRDTVELLRTAADSRLVIEVHGLGRSRFEPTQAALERFEAKVEAAE